MDPTKTPYDWAPPETFNFNFCLANHTPAPIAKFARENLEKTTHHMQTMTDIENFFTGNGRKPPSGQKAQKEVQDLQKKQDRLFLKGAKIKEWREHILKIKSLQEEVLLYTKQMEKFHRQALRCSGCLNVRMGPVMMLCDGASEEMLVCQFCTVSGKFSGSFQLREDEVLHDLATKLWPDLDHGFYSSSKWYLDAKTNTRFRMRDDGTWEEI